MMFPKPPKRGKGPAPRKVVLAVLERDNWTCQRCGTMRNLDRPHHIFPKGRGGGHDPDNQVTLCRKCHSWVHRHPKKAREQGFTV